MLEVRAERRIDFWRLMSWVIRPPHFFLLPCPLCLGYNHPLDLVVARDTRTSPHLLKTQEYCSIDRIPLETQPQF